MMRKLLMAAVATMCLYGCKTKEAAMGSTAREARAQMLWIEGNVVLDEQTAARRMTVTVVETLDGQVKSTLNADTEYLCRLLDSSGKTVATYGMEDPLTRHVEYVGDNGELGMKTERLDSADFLIRLPLERRASKVRFIYRNKKLLDVDIP